MSQEHYVKASVEDHPEISPEVSFPGSSLAKGAGAEAVGTRVARCSDDYRGSLHPQGLGAERHGSSSCYFQPWFLSPVSVAEETPEGNH